MQDDLKCFVSKVHIQMIHCHSNRITSLIMRKSSKTKENQTILFIYIIKEDIEKIQINLNKVHSIESSLIYNVCHSSNRLALVFPEKIVKLLFFLRKNAFVICF